MELTKSEAGPVPQPILPTVTGQPGIDLRQWWGRWGLALAAGLTWVFLVAGYLIDGQGEAQVAIGSYVLSYLAGGTLATRAAIDDLRDRRVNIDLLMVLAAIGAATIGAWAEGAVLLALFSTSNALEHHALARTRNAVRALMDLSPLEATVERNGTTRVVPVEELVVGDVVLVRPGERVPADGEVLSGTTEIDQAAMTGESMPVAKRPGDEVFAGTVNGSGAFRLGVTRPASESTLARITRLVAAAQSRKSRAERFTDAFEGPYAIGVIAFATLVALVPIALGANPGDAFYRAMTVLVVASPCALVISTPAATLSAIANAARNGVLVKGGSYLDALGAVDTIAFDKTGTLTVGRPTLTEVRAFGTSETDALRLAAAVEHLSEHPIAAAIVAGARSRGIRLPDIQDVKADPGRGVAGQVDGKLIAVGNEGLFEQLGTSIPDDVRDLATELRRAGRTAVLAGDRDRIFAVFGVADQLRSGVTEAIADLKRRGVSRMVMLTGDSPLVAEAIAREVGIDEVHAGLQPEEKLARIEALRRKGTVAMVGDGVNDAPALATADLGVAMGAGSTDVALETADVVLITGDLGRLAYAIGLSRRMRSVIRFCIGFALSVIVVLLAFALTAGIPLPLGVVGHEGSTIVVVLAGLTLLAYGRRKDLRQP